MNKTFTSVLVLILSSLYSITPLILQPEFTFGEDIGYHIGWSHQVSMSMKEGIIYPRWLSLSNGGYGSPTTIFYAPLFYLLTGVLNLFIPSLIVSLKVVTFAGFFLSGMAMYLFLRNFCGHAGAVAGGMAYQLLPYHIFDLYWRGTFAETFAFAWLPLIMHFSYKGASEDKLHYWIGLSFSYAGLVLTHIASAFIFTFVIAAYALFLSFNYNGLRILFKSALAFLFGLSLSSAYFIPMVHERRFVHIEFLTEVSWGDYTRNFLFMVENSDNLFHINLEQIVMVKIFLVVTAMTLIYYKCREYRNLHAAPFVFFSWLYAFSLFISTPLSMPLWGIIPGLPTIQFPWRWEMVSVLSASILVGMTFDNISLADIQRDRFIRIFAAAFHAFVAANLYLSSSYILKARPAEEKEVEWILKSGGDVIEYRPIWLTGKRKDFSREERTYVNLTEGSGSIEIVSWKSHSRSFSVTAELPSTVRISTFYYPGWNAEVNGRGTPIHIEKDSGAMLISLPPGRNKILLEFRDTLLRKSAKWISILSFFAAMFTLAVARLRRPSTSTIGKDQ